jgi:uncharacterized protein YecE (DUF72 family)
MQDLLFSDPAEPAPRATERTKPPERAEKAAGKAKVEAHPHDPELAQLRAALPPHLWLGTSSWTYPGWADMVWQGEYAEAALSKHGLAAYARHPLFRTVSLDRAFYRPLTVSQYAGFAAQVPADFRFVVKAPSVVTDAMVRGETGRGMQPNPAFLSHDIAVHEFVRPALEGLGDRTGALVFQLSPLPPQLLSRIAEVIERIGSMLQALPALQPEAPDAVVAVEVRDPAFLIPEFAAMLREVGATYCLGVHAKMPPIAKQLPMLRKLWPGPLVCRWNLHRKHGAYGYEEAGRLYQPFSRIVDDDPETRAALARVVAGTNGAGQKAYVTVSNQAEGCAPLSVAALARQIAELSRSSSG